MIEDPFGNYLVQNVIKLRGKRAIMQIVRYLCTDLAYFARQKFSSNVVERVLEFADAEGRSLLF